MYRFNGGTSFMSNGYVIWKDGLGKYPKPNWFAVKQGESYVQKMFYTRSLDQRSSFFQFTNFLTAIQQKEEAKERNYINSKLEKMRNNIFEKERIIAVQRAIDDNNFGAAYSLLLDLDTSIQELKREFFSSESHFNNESHMNKFWNIQFSSYLQKVLEQRSEIQGKYLVKKLEDSPLTIEELVNGWMSEILSGSDGAIVQSLEPIREKMKSELLGYLQKHGIQGVKTYTDDIFGVDSNFTELSGFKTTRKRGGHRNVKALTRLIADKIGDAVGKGLSQELATTAEQGKHGATAFNVGEFYKTISKGLKSEKFQQVYQKADVTSFEIFQGTYDIGKVASEVFFENGYNQTAYNKFVDALEEAAQNNVGQIFEVDINVKGYRSRRDLQIEGEGSFNQRTKNLVKMSQQAKGIPSFSMEKLIFMLNNTVEGCIADNEIENLTKYIAAVCAAWMWDDYTELFSLSEKGSAIQKIRMFNSGGMYYSASQIMKKTLEELLSDYKGSSFVTVDIKPPVFDANQKYQSLRKEYPIPNNQNYEDWQKALKPRWDEMRDYVAAHGKVSIKFRQKELEKLISNLRNYL